MGIRIIRIRTLHRWAGLIVGIQVLLWFAGGLVMSALPIHMVHGDHLVKRVEPVAGAGNAHSYSLDKLVNKLRQQGLRIDGVSFTHDQDMASYVVNTDKGTQVYDARSGEALARPGVNDIRQRALALYRGEGEVVSVVRVAPPQEVGKSEVPLIWRVDFDDAINTSLYFDTHRGRLLKVRSDIWRVFDFAWMLHIMDYDKRSDFNHPLLIIFAFGATVFSLSGLALLYQWARIRLRQHRALA